MNSRPTTRAQRRQLIKESHRFPKNLIEINFDEWPDVAADQNRQRVWRSQDFLVQQFYDEGYTRLAVNRTVMRHDGRWKDGISWDDLQKIKRECGYGDCCAFEVYPDDLNIVDVANMRHLWILPAGETLGWIRGEASE